MSPSAVPDTPNPYQGRQEHHGEPQHSPPLGILGVAAARRERLLRRRHIGRQRPVTSRSPTRTSSRTAATRRTFRRSSTHSRKENPDITVEVETPPYADYFTDAADRPRRRHGVRTSSTSTTRTTRTTRRTASLAPLEVSDPAVYRDVAARGRSRPTASSTALPSSFSTVVLFYNKDLFEAAGVETHGRRMDLGRRAVRGRSAHRQGRGGLGRLPAGELLRVLQGARADRRNFLELRHEGRVQLARGRRGRRMARRQERNRDAHRSNRARAPRTSTPTCSRTASSRCGYTGIWMFGAFADAPFGWDIAVEPGNTQQASATVLERRRRLGPIRERRGGDPSSQSSSPRRHHGRHAPRRRLGASRRSPTMPSSTTYLTLGNPDQPPGRLRFPRERGAAAGRRRGPAGDAGHRDRGARRGAGRSQDRRGGPRPQPRSASTPPSAADHGGRVRRPPDPAPHLTCGRSTRHRALHDPHRSREHARMPPPTDDTASRRSPSRARS